MAGVFKNWSPEMSENFSQKPVMAEHTLHERPMFSDAGLADLIDRYPREELNLYTTGKDLTDHEAGFRRGVAGDNLTGAEILQAINRGKLWLNIRAVNEYLPEYDALCDEMFGEMDSLVPGLKTLKRDCGVLISSPKARVFYHLDIPCVSLWQIRGEKTVYVYPKDEPFVSDEQIESIILSENEEEITYNPSFESGAMAFEFNPGKMLAWPQMAPHRVDNGDCVNISLSCEFHTFSSLLRANTMYTNGVMRRKFGTNPSVANDGKLSSYGKAAMARALKLAKKKPTIDEIAPPTFHVDLAEETGIREFSAA